LSRAGVEYIEIRALDISPFDPVGLGQSQQKFLEAFLIYALLLDSPPISELEQNEIRQNQLLVAGSGRETGLQLRRAGGAHGLKDWAREICAQMVPVCELLDNEGDNGFSEALSHQLAAIDDSSLTPSARLLADLDDTGLEFADYGMQTAVRYRDYFADLSEDLNQHAAVFADEATDSIARQQEIEQTDSISLDEYISRYYS
jgi:glutamate--cysteine ligase